MVAGASVAEIAGPSMMSQSEQIVHDFRSDHTRLETDGPANVAAAVATAAQGPVGNLSGDAVHATANAFDLLTL